MRRPWNNASNVNHRLTTSSEFFREHRARREPLVLATIAHTLGSTYRKAGAQMLLAADGSAAGLLSGGCLETDLMEHARKVLDTGRALRIEYDTRGSDDPIWGIGLGCEGAMQILLTRLDAGNDYQPFAHAEASRETHTAASFALVTESNNSAHPLGKAYWPGSREVPPAAIAATLATAAAPGQQRVSSEQAEDATFLIVPVTMPTRLLVLGAGPDAMPVVEIAGLLGWQVTVADHRAAYIVADRFPRAQRVVLNAASALPQLVAGKSFDAAVVMSHHLHSDEAYLRGLADSAIPYLGLLGPAPRRARLMNDIGEKAQGLLGRLYGPIGLDIGADTPESIALAIVSEIQAVLSRRDGGSFSAAVRQSC